MFKKLVIIFLLLITFAACKNTGTINYDNITADIKDNVTDNASSDNASIQKDIYNETVIDVFINNSGEIITKIYKINRENISKNLENKELLLLLSKYNNNKCINWIIDALKYNNINNNLADTYIKYNDIYLYEPVVLHIAVLCENIDILNALLSFGADIQAEDNSGENVLMLAEKINNKEIIEIITKEYENGF